MTVDNLVLFAHVAGAIGYCMGIAMLFLVLVGLRLGLRLGLRRARRVAEAHTLIYVNNPSGPIGAASAPLILVAALYQALREWSVLTSWVLVALIRLLVMDPTSALLIAPRRGAIVRQVEREASGGEISP